MEEPKMAGYKLYCPKCFKENRLSKVHYQVRTIPDYRIRTPEHTKRNYSCHRDAGPHAPHDCGWAYDVTNDDKWSHIKCNGR